MSASVRMSISIGTCESLQSSSRPFDLLQLFYTSTERLTRLKLLKYAFTETQTCESHVLQLFLWDLFIILSRFLAGFCFVKMSQAFQNPSINFYRT